MLTLLIIKEELLVFVLFAIMDTPKPRFETCGLGGLLLQINDQFLSICNLNTKCSTLKTNSFGPRFDPEGWGTSWPYIDQCASICYLKTNKKTRVFYLHNVIVRPVFGPWRPGQVMIGHRQVNVAVSSKLDLDGVFDQFIKHAICKNPKNGFRWRV